MPKPTAAAVYARISSDQEGTAAGVKRQLADCHELAGREGWTVAEEYVDNDISAYSGKRRPAYQRMLEDLADGVRDAVIVYHQDRLTRRPIELEQFLDVIMKAGVTDVRVDTELGAIEREYEHMDDESFIAFGQRLAGEIGGTFKVRNNIAVMAKRNAARSPLGIPLPSVIAARGDNLIEWSVAPYIGRPRYSQIRVRYYDTATAKYEEIVIETGIVGGDATAVGRFRARNKAAAEDKANAIRANCERGSGMGSVTIEGNVGAQAEATCAIVGARIGVDGLYVIDGVDHRYTRAGGFVTTLQLAYPA